MIFSSHYPLLLSYYYIYYVYSILSIQKTLFSANSSKNCLEAPRSVTGNLHPRTIGECSTTSSWAKETAASGTLPVLHQDKNNN
jgi:hypothetical protein